MQGAFSLDWRINSLDWVTKTLDCCINSLDWTFLGKSYFQILIVLSSFSFSASLRREKHGWKKYRVEARQEAQNS